MEGLPQRQVVDGLKGGRLCPGCDMQIRLLFPASAVGGPPPATVVFRRVLVFPIQHTKNEQRGALVRMRRPGRRASSGGKGARRLHGDGFRDRGPALSVFRATPHGEYPCGARCRMVGSSLERENPFPGGGRTLGPHGRPPVPGERGGEEDKHLMGKRRPDDGVCRESAWKHGVLCEA